MWSVNLGQEAVLRFSWDLKIAEDRTVDLAVQEEIDEQDGNKSFRE